MPRTKLADKSLYADDATLRALILGFLHVLESSQDLDRVLDEHEQVQRVLLHSLALRAQKELVRPDEVFEGARSKVKAEIERAFGPALPADLLKVQKYNRTHALLLGYLLARVGVPVTAARLRTLVGDQVHTERRVRELRDLGFEIGAEVVAGRQHYILGSSRQDLVQAAKRQVRKSIKRTKHHSGAQKAAFLAVLDND